VDKRLNRPSSVINQRFAHVRTGCGQTGTAQDRQQTNCVVPVVLRSFNDRSEWPSTNIRLADAALAAFKGNLFID
jgi:hypothetical protein